MKAQLLLYLLPLTGALALACQSHQGAPPSERSLGGSASPVSFAQDRQSAGSLALPDLTPENLAEWAQHIHPRGAELGAEGIDWIPDFAQGVLEASRQEKPLLFWAMNGHPLGCT